MSCECNGVCVLEGSSDVKGTIYFEKQVRKVGLQSCILEELGGWGTLCHLWHSYVAGAQAEALKVQLV